MLSSQTRRPAELAEDMKNCRRLQSAVAVCASAADKAVIPTGIMLGVTLMLLVDMLVPTGRNLRNGLGLAVVAGRTAHLQTAGNRHNGKNDAGRRIVEIAKARLMVFTEDVCVVHVAEQHHSQLFWINGDGECFLCGQVRPDLDYRSHFSWCQIYHWPLRHLSVNRLWGQTARNYFPEVQPRTNYTRRAFAVIDESKPNHSDGWLIADRTAIKRDQLYVDPWAFEARHRLLRQVSLVFDGPQSEQSYDDVGSGDSDHDPFGDSRFWSYMVGALMFLLGCGFAHEAARLWIDCRRLRMSLCFVAVGFSFLYFGQAFVFFGFWW